MKLSGPQARDLGGLIIIYLTSEDGMYLEEALKAVEVARARAFCSISSPRRRDPRRFMRRKSCRGARRSERRVYVRVFHCHFL